MVGSSFKTIAPTADYISKKDFSSLNFNVKDKYIIHLAAKVGGIKANSDGLADFYCENSEINNKVLKHAFENKARKVVSLLSTCVYPDQKYVSYPLTEDQLHIGPPHESNFGYAYAKRMLDVMSRAYRAQHECNFITAIPNNLYGENDNFHINDSHVIPGLIRKIWEAKIKGASFIEAWGDGSPLREFTYAKDIANILLFLLENYNEPGPINIGSTEEYSIKDITEIICKELEYTGEVVWDTSKPNGQFKKPSSNKKLIDIGWKKEWYTPFDQGIKNVCDWFKTEYPNVRGMN